MDKKYIKLFEELAHNTAISAEKVMDYDIEKQDKQGYETAQIMRNNYEDLKTRISEAGNNYMLTKSDAAKLTVSTIITLNQLQDQVNLLQKAIAGYKNNLLPKLQEIVDTAESDEMAQQLANEKFIIEEEVKEKIEE